MTESALELDFKSTKSNDVLLCKRMKSFRVSKALDDCIRNECEKRHTDFSSFIRDAAIEAMATRHGRDNEATL